MDTSLEEKFCKYFKKLGQSYNEVEVTYIINDFKTIICFYYDQKLDLEREKRNLNLFTRNSKIRDCGWSTKNKIVTQHLQFNYRDVLFNRQFRYVSSFEFARK